MLGYIPVAFYDDASEKTGASINGITVKGTIDELLSTKSIENQYDEIYIALPLRAEERIKQILNAMADSSITVKFIPRLFSASTCCTHASPTSAVSLSSAFTTAH